MSLISTAELQHDEELELEDLLKTPEFDEVKPGNEVVIELEEPKDDSVIFSLPLIPGAEDQSEIEVEPSSEIEVTEPGENVEVAEKDPWDWQSLGHSKFLDWLTERLKNLPGHTGHDTVGIEKIISCLDSLNKEISKAVRTDYKNEIDSSKAEKYREEIEDGISRCIDRLEKLQSSKFKRHNKKKKAELLNDGIVKEAQKIPGVTGIVVTVPLLISRCARVCINGTISAGHDMEDMYDQQVKLYKLNMREQAELQQLIEDMGFPIVRDRGIAPDKGMKRSDQDNFDWNQNFPG